MTLNDLDAVDAKLILLYGARDRNEIAVRGSYSYLDPVTGDTKTGTVSAEEKAAAAAALASVLAAFKAAADALS